MVTSSTLLAPKLVAAYDRGKLGHALIFKVLGSGDLDISHQDFFEVMLALQCTRRNLGQAHCNQCESCRLLQAMQANPTLSHPDTLWIQPESEMGYTVDQIRELSRFLSLKGNLAANRVVWISQAEKLYASQGAAANALLKLLEEPRPGCFFFLSSRQPELLMATIRSRCHQYVLRPQKQDLHTLSGEWQELLKWLQEGAPQNLSFACPCDEESFWKDRKQALKEVSSVQEHLWRDLKQSFHRFSREQGFRVLDFFSGLEQFIVSLRHYSNANLQWLNFKLQARQGLLWKP